MPDLTSEQELALAYARHLADSGVPVFLAQQDRRSKIGFRLPNNWQHTSPDPEVVDRWRPGMALCAVMGHVVDALDVDAHKGGNATLATLRADGLVPRSYGCQRTPSGGTHDLIASLGVRSKDGLAAGVDIKAGDTDGNGRGFVFIAPTEKPSKVTGQYVAYEWETPPNLSFLALVGEDDSGASLAAMVQRGRSSDAGPVADDGPSYDGPDYDNLSPGERDMADREVERVVSWWRGRLADAADWPDGERDDKDRGWEALAYQSAWALAMLAVAPWSGLDTERARELYGEVLPDVIAADEKCQQKWSPALVGKAASQPTQQPPWAEAFDPVSDDDEDDDAPTGGRGVKLAVRLRWHVETNYNVFPAGDDGRIFAQPSGGGRAELVSGGFVMRATKGMGDTAATLSASATEAAKVLSAYGATSEPRKLSLRAHYQRGRIVLDLAQRGNTRCVVVTPDGWSAQDVPPAEIVFQASGSPLPDPVRDGSIEELRELLRWDPDDPRWPLVKGWLPAALLADLPRPMLGFFGPQGSAKTTTGRFVAGVLDPKPSGALGGGFGKSRSDDETKALKSYIPAWDNVSTLSNDGADLLSRLVTGELIERRQLYTDADLVTIHYRRTGVMTGITVPRGVKPDTLDRFILVSVQPITGARVSEGALDAEWERVQPRVLAGVLDLAVTMLSRLESARGRNTAGLRMADYAEALWAIDPALYDAYAENVGTARADMAAEDPFIGTLLAWLRSRKGSYEGTAEQARWDAETHMADGGQWWPRNAKAFSDEVTRTAELLKAVGITVADRRSNGRRLKRFELVEFSDDDLADLI